MPSCGAVGTPQAQSVPSSPPAGLQSAPTTQHGFPDAPASGRDRLFANDRSQAENASRTFWAGLKRCSFQRAPGAPWAALAALVAGRRMSRQRAAPLILSVAATLAGPSAAIKTAVRLGVCGESAGQAPAFTINAANSEPPAPGLHRQNPVERHSWRGCWQSSGAIGLDGNTRCFRRAAFGRV